MAKQTVNIGAAPNDGTGDAIRDAFNKINSNFDEVYSSYTATGAITVGNSTVNSVVSNTGGLVVANPTSSTVANTSILKVGNTTVNAVINSSSLVIGNTTVNSSVLYVGNSTVNTSHSVSAVQLANSTSNASLTAGGLFIGNSTVNATANSSTLRISTANVTSNTGLTLGSSTDAANGYTFLPNGFKMNWGWVSSNSTTGTVVFTPNFTTNAYSVVATSNNTTATYQAAVISWDKTSAQIRTANAASTNVYWIAIGK